MKIIPSKELTEDFVTEQLSIERDREFGSVEKQINSEIKSKCHQLLNGGGIIVKIYDTEIAHISIWEICSHIEAGGYSVHSSKPWSALFTELIIKKVK